MDFKISGLDDLQKELKKIGDNARNLHGKHEVPVGELFDQAFMRKHTLVSTFTEFLALGGFVNSQEEFASIPDDVFDRHVISNSNFTSWNEMQETALADYVTKKLGL